MRSGRGRVNVYHDVRRTLLCFVSARVFAPVKSASKTAQQRIRTGQTISCHHRRYDDGLRRLHEISRTGSWRRSGSIEPLKEFDERHWRVTGGTDEGGCVGYFGLFCCRFIRRIVADDCMDAGGRATQEAKAELAADNGCQQR